MARTFRLDASPPAVAPALRIDRGVGRPRRRARFERFGPSGRALVGALLLAASPAWANVPADALEESKIVVLRRQAVALEHGDGVARDGVQAAALYCEAARLGDAASQYDLGWMYVNGRGVPRDDGVAAFFFEAAAGQGVRQADNMLRLIGSAPVAAPDCMRDPVAVAPAAEAAPAASAEPEALLPIAAPQKIVDLVARVAREYAVPPRLILAIIEAESRFNLAAVSPKNAQGLMQLIPETASRFGVRNAFDPTQNVRGGAAYVRWLLAYFEGDVALVAAAYNAGERTVERYRGVPPYGETRAYVRRILSNVRTVAQPYDPSVVDPSPLLAQIRERQRTP